MSALFIDVDTQLDFLYPAGALYVPGAERLVPALARLTQFAAQHGIPVVSTADAHAENDVEFQSWPKHCVAGATGQHKVEATLLPRRVTVPNRDGDLLELAGGLAIEGAQQIVVEKQTVDAFQTRTFARIVRLLNPGRFVVYGVVTEICVLHAVRGLLQFGKPLTVVTDAIQPLTAQASRDALAEMRAAGAILATAAEVTACAISEVR
jgi:nicotinamidase/pyrazinamidase